jgi:flagellar motor protein MotB
VALALTELGAGAGVLQVVAASDSEPIYDESQPTGEAGNRRVEIFLEY